MQALRPTPSPALRWGGAFAIVLALHAVVAWWLLRAAIPPMTMPAAPEVVMLDLAPDLPPIEPAAVVPPVPAALAPPPIELPPMPPMTAETVLPVPPPPMPSPRPQAKPKPRPIERPAVHQPAPPAVTEMLQPVAPAPVQAAPAQTSARPAAPVSTVPPSWRNDLLARLQRAKRYPDPARSRGDQGVATVTFTLDRAGRVLGVNLVHSSGSNLLDEEAVALVRRAEPLPSLPDDMPGSSITLTVPISFALR